MKLISARESRAPAPIRTANRAPDIFAARSKSRIPSADPMSQCGFGSKSNARGSPWRRTSTLSSALFPTGVLLALEPLDLQDLLAPLRVERGKRLQDRFGIQAAVTKARPHLVEMF